MHDPTENSAEQKRLDNTDFPLLSDERPERAAEYCRLALQQIQRHSATLVPLNYALFYCYVAGHNQQLNEKMEALLNTNPAWQHDGATRLFLRYLTPCNDVAMSELQEDLLSVLQEVIKATCGAADGIDHRAEALDQHVAELANCRDPREVFRIASQVLRETHLLAQESKALASEIQASAQEVEKLKLELVRARREGTVDSLTGLHNRKAFDDVLKQLIEKAETFGLIIMDVDHFKMINDQHGHLVGDRVLCQLAKVLSSRTRATDTVSRYGGEEFAVLLPNTPISETRRVAEQLREGIRSLNMRRTDNGTRIGKVTASFGVAEYFRGETAYQLIARADNALYQAKRNGRDRVELADRSQPDEPEQYPQEQRKLASPL
jgi:diguanylate cyclase